MINSKAKGSKFERVVAKLLSSIYGVEFHRTPMSGGLHWKDAHSVSGDIVPPEGMDFKYSIECKNCEESWDFDKLHNGSSKVFDWWEQAERDAMGKVPVLIFKKNRKEIHAMISLKHKFNPLKKLKSQDYVQFSHNGESFILMEFTEEYIKAMKED